MNNFICDKCGKCCENLDKSHIYDDLNDGTGVCVNYDKQTHLCKIYDQRPLKCNIEKSYTLFKDKITYDEYLNLNYTACKVLKAKGE